MNGMMLGMALALMGLGAGAEVASDDGMVSFRVRMLEMPGLEWRSAVYGQLEKVGDKNGATVWTGPVSVLEKLEEEADGGIMIAPRVTCQEGFEASLRTGTERRYVAYLHRKSDGPVMQGSAVAFLPEVRGCQDGLGAKLSGRKVDQGMLLRLDLEESQVAAIHSVTVKDGVRGTEENGFRPSTVNASYQVPEIRGSRVQGEWVVPTDGVLVVSLGVRSTEAGQPEIRERVVVIEPVAGAGHGVLPVPSAARDLMPKELPSLPFTGAMENDGSGLLAIVPMVSPVAGWAIAGISAIEASPPVMSPTFGKVDAGLGLTSALATKPSVVVNGHPEIPSRHIPQGFAANGEAVELPPLPLASTAEPAVTSEPTGTPQSRTFPPACPAVSSPAAAAALASASTPAPVASSTIAGEPVPMAVSELSSGQGANEPPSIAVVAGSRIELTGNVRIKATDGTLMEADSAVVTTPGQVFESSETAENSGYDLDFEAEAPEWVGNRQATGPGVDQKVAQASASEEALDARTFIQRIPVLGGAIELKVRVSHGKESATRP